MGQLTNLSFTKADGTTSVTYGPLSSSNGSVKWKETGAANDFAATVVGLQRLPVKKASAQVRKRVAVLIPIMEVSSGANSSGYTAGPKVAFTIGANLDFLLNRRATAAQKLELLTLVGRLIGFNGANTGNAVIYDIVNDEVIT